MIPSTDVIILSSTPLGFNTPKSKNYKFCKDLYNIHSEKNCNVFAAVSQGKGYELNSLVESIKLYTTINPYVPRYLF